MCSAGKRKREGQGDKVINNDEVSATDKSKNKITNELSPRGERLKKQLLSKIVPWENITVSLDNFPHYLEERTKTLLVECVASHLKQKKLKKYRGHFKSSSEKILLQTIPGTEIYRERLVSALAQEFQVPLLKVDDIQVDDEVSQNTKTLKKGDRVKYTGNITGFKEVNKSYLAPGDRGEVCEVDGDRVAVVFNIFGLGRLPTNDETNNETLQAVVTWLDVKHVQQDNDDAKNHDYFIAMEVLYGQVLASQQHVIVYFPNSHFWPSNSDQCAEFLAKIEKIFNQLPGGVVTICAENQLPGSEAMKRFPESLRNFITGSPPPPKVSEMKKIFTNVVCIDPPKEEDLLNKFIKQIEEDRSTEIAEANLSEMLKVLKEYNQSCIDLKHANVRDMKLTSEKAEKIVGWATNHYLSTCELPCVNEEILNIPLESINLAISRLREEEEVEEAQTKKLNIEKLADGKYEESLVSAVIRSEDIGVNFDDIGALETVKKVLHETVILPLRRPELFSHGNLLKPCKGILLFGPPGTGKTLTAKALATESGATFINVTTAAITSMWVGESEHLTRALFSLATKLAPVVIFVDEVDSLLGARTSKSSSYDTSRLNEFMSAWDGLTSKESQRILVVGATNRPFDLDDAVLHRMPRRVYVGLPDVNNRVNILKVLLSKENLHAGFSLNQLAEATEGYSGSDLKNLCVAAAYRPVEELLEQESKKVTLSSNGVAALRPLHLNDFISAKAKVRPSVSQNADSIIKLRKWNQQYREGSDTF